MTRDQHIERVRDLHRDALDAYSEMTRHRFDTSKSARHQRVAGELRHAILAAHDHGVSDAELAGALRMTVDAVETWRTAMVHARARRTARAERITT